MIKKADPKAKAINEGNLAEGVLGAAVIAKLLNRQPSGLIGKVSAPDILKILKIMQKTPGTPQGASKTQIKVDTGGSAKDRISFSLNLGTAMMGELRRLDLKLLYRLAEAAASYANSSRISSFAEYLYVNNTNNKVEIIVDGISDNSGTKKDIEVKADKILFDRISLKAGSNTLGQVGGNSWSSILRVFDEGLNKRTKKKQKGLCLPINVKATEDKYMKMITEKPTFSTVAKAVKYAYDEAAKIFNRQSKGTLAKSVSDFLHLHSSSNDENIKIVKLDTAWGGSHKVLSPARLDDALSKASSLQAVVRLDTQWPIFLVYENLRGVPPPTTIYSENVIFSITVKIDSRQMGYIYHVIKHGDHFEKLLEVKE